MTTYLMRVIVAFDMFANVILFGNADQTISSRAALAWHANRPWGCFLCRILDWLEKDHCLNAVVNDRARAQLIVEIEILKAELRTQVRAEHQVTATLLGRNN
jgi:hypothetical protein